MEVVQATQNYRNGHGWETRVLSGKEVAEIQRWVRFMNSATIQQSMEDARNVLSHEGYKKPTLNEVLAVAVPLFEKRTIHVTRVCDETLRSLIADERRATDGAFE